MLEAHLGKENLFAHAEDKALCAIDTSDDLVVEFHRAPVVIPGSWVFCADRGHALRLKIGREAHHDAARGTDRVA